jgi:hypothetical protein
MRKIAKINESFSVRRKTKIVFLAAMSFICSLAAQASPGFSEAPKSGSRLRAADDTTIVHVVSELEQTHSFEFSLKDPRSKSLRKVRVIFLEAAGASEADPEIPRHLLSARSEELEEDDSASMFLVNPMFIDTVQQISPNRLHIEGRGGSAYGCELDRKMDIELNGQLNKETDQTIYSFKYLNVVDKRTGPHCDYYGG